MNTIVRKNGHVEITATVVKTIAYVLKRRKGFIRIEQIVNLINMQIAQHEYVTRRMVFREIVKILDNKHNERGNRYHG